MKVSCNLGCNLGFFGLLAIAFIVLKLCGVISWSWWVVVLPVLVPVFVMVIFFALWIWATSR